MKPVAELTVQDSNLVLRVELVRFGVKVGDEVDVASC